MQLSIMTAVLDHFLSLLKLHTIIIFRFFFWLLPIATVTVLTITLTQTQMIRMQHTHWDKPICKECLT